MAYNIPFQFNPVPPSEQSFNINNKTVEGLGQTGIDVDTNPYVPGCNDNSLQMKDNYRGMVDSYVQSYGMKISYWTTGFDIDNHTFIYGEDPTAKYRGPRSMKAIIDFQSYTTFLTKWGIMSDLLIVIYIPIKAFQAVWGPIVPLAGDLFIIDDSACDRPLGQSPMVFEVTEKHDSINPVDFMGGHYVWKITAKRYDNSYEPGAPQEKDIGGPVDSPEYGLVESDISEALVVQNPTGHNANEEAKKDFDTPNDSVYGKYF